MSAIGVVRGTGKVTVAKPVLVGVDTVPIDSKEDEGPPVIAKETLDPGAIRCGHVLNVVDPEVVYVIAE